MHRWCCPSIQILLSDCWLAWLLCTVHTSLCMQWLHELWRGNVWRKYPILICVTHSMDLVLSVTCNLLRRDDEKLCWILNFWDIILLETLAVVDLCLFTTDKTSVRYWISALDSLETLAVVICVYTPQIKPEDCAVVNEITSAAKIPPRSLDVWHITCEKSQIVRHFSQTLSLANCS